MGNAPESLVDPNGESPYDLQTTPFVRPTPQMPVGKPKYNGPSANRMDDFDSWKNDLATGRAAQAARIQRQQVAESFAEANALYQQGNGVQQEGAAGNGGGSIDGGIVLPEVVVKDKGVVGEVWGWLKKTANKVAETTA